MCVLNVTLPHVRFNGLLAMLNDDAVGSACATYQERVAEYRRKTDME